MPIDTATFEAKVAIFIANRKAAFADGVSFADFAQALREGITLFVETAAGLTNATGEEKKALVLSAVSAVFDSLWPLVAGWSLWLFALKPVIRPVVMYFAAEAIELAYQALVAKGGA